MASSSSTLRLGYFGRAGSFSHVVAERRFAGEKLSECPTVEECFARLESGEYTHILVPIENASSGIITNTADQLMRLAKTFDQGPARATMLVREALVMRVRLMLMARADTKVIAKIYSHRAPFDHSREWLQKHYPEAEQVIVESTSEAASIAAKERGSAAIAGEQALEAFKKLHVVNKEVGSEVPNQTTFVVVGPELARPVKPTHTSLVFELPHKAGSLVAVLQVLSRRGLNLTKILSRPIPGRFEEYRFMIEFLGAPDDANVAAALKRISKITTFCAVIGSYPVRRVQ